MSALQTAWTCLLKWELDLLLPETFVGSDLRWYPIEADPGIALTVPILVAFGRPKGDRVVYRQWEENDVAPQVVLEVLAPRCCLTETFQRLSFYDRYGVEECYLYNPETFALTAALRGQNDRLWTHKNLNGFVSPRLGIRFDAPGDCPLTVTRPDGTRFRTLETMQQTQEQAQRMMARLRAELDERTP